VAADLRNHTRGSDPEREPQIPLGQTDGTDLQGVPAIPVIGGGQ
jgi:hypothetical protein